MCKNHLLTRYGLSKSENPSKNRSKYQLSDAVKSDTYYFATQFLAGLAVPIVLNMCIKFQAITMMHREEITVLKSI